MKANKDLGQHFLTDQSVIQKITSQNFIEQCNYLIEVGPGKGALTQYLSKLDKELYLIEKDTRFTELLQGYTPISNITFQDAMDINWNEFIGNKDLNNIWMISNLPYNIGTLLTLRFIQADQIQFMTLMMQKEVGYRFLPQKNNDMNALAVLAKTYFEIDKLCLVPPGAFSPPPKVDSIVLNFIRKKAPVISLNEWNQLESFLKNLFKFRRKQIRKVLSSSYKIKEVEESLEALSIPFTLRAESLELGQIYGLYQSLTKK